MGRQLILKGENLTEENLVEWAKTRMGKFEVPEKMVFTEEIPRAPTGKILKRVLRDQSTGCSRCRRTTF